MRYGDLGYIHIHVWVIGYEVACMGVLVMWVYIGDV